MVKESREEKLEKHNRGRDGKGVLREMKSKTFGLYDIIIYDI